MLGIDNLPGSVAIDAYALPRRCVLLFGQEGPGLSDEARELSEAVLAIRQFGSTRSINAAAASAVAMHEWVRRHARVRRWRLDRARPGSRPVGSTSTCRRQTASTTQPRWPSRVHAGHSGPRGRDASRSGPKQLRSRTNANTVSSLGPPTPTNPRPGAGSSIRSVTLVAVRPSTTPASGGRRGLR